MPRYFISLINSDSTDPRAEALSRDFENDAAALGFVRDVATFLGPVPAFDVLSRYRLRVTDAGGRCVLDEPLARREHLSLRKGFPLGLTYVEPRQARLHDVVKRAGPPSREQ